MKNLKKKKKIINKYQCGNDIDSSPLLNNANKYAKFHDPNRNGWSCINRGGDLVTMAFDLFTSSW